VLKGDVAPMPGSLGTGRTRPVSDLTTLSGVVLIFSLVLGVTALVGGLVGTVGPREVLVAPPVEPSPDLGLRTFVVGLDEPTAAVAIPGADAFYVLERLGRVRIARRRDLDPVPALDLSHRIVNDAIEQGLVGIALHPTWADSGRVFLGWIDPNLTLMISEFRSDPTTLALDPGSERLVLSLAGDPDGRFHLGGTIRFGPDGYLWVAVGDGSSTPGFDDAFGHGSNPQTLRGSLLRIDVDRGDGYAIPTTNPFVDGVEGAPEVWAYGFRNPWAFTFDVDHGRVVVADVGESRFEEINLVDLGHPGHFFGWSQWEGAWCRREAECRADALVPIAMFSHDEMCAIIGGVVYVGRAIPTLRDRYVYADWCSGRLSSVSLDGDHTSSYLPLRAIERPSNFTVDEKGEIYVIQFRRGRMLKIVPRS